MVSNHFFLVLLVLLVGYFLLCFLRRKIKKKHHRGPAIYPIVGSAFECFRNRHRFLHWFTETAEKMPTNTFEIERPGGVRDIITANPSNIEHMLKTNFENYPKGERLTFVLHDFLGRGIFNADAELWKMQRKTASYEFNTKSLRSFVLETVQWEIQNRLVLVLSNACETGKSLDLQDVLQRFGFDNICKVAFGVDPCCLLPSLPTSQLSQAFDNATDITAARIASAVPFLWRIKRMFNIGSEKRLREAINVVDKFALNVVRSRRREMTANGGGCEREDLVSRFMAACSNNLNQLRKQDYFEGDKKSSGTMDMFLKEMVVSFMLAGRDTTSVALAWFFWLLSLHPKVEEAIHSEILQVLTLRSAQSPEEEIALMSFEELKDMQYLHAALCESMRLYPPLPVNSKFASHDDVLPDGTRVEKGCNLNYSSYSMGRMENIWGSDCLEFKPERWLNKGEFVGESPYKFPVFHAGPRVCLGKEMAFIQMKSIVASVIHRFRYEVVEEGVQCREWDYALSLTMRMRGGLPVTVTYR